MSGNSRDSARHFGFAGVDPHSPTRTYPTTPRYNFSIPQAAVDGAAPPNLPPPLTLGPSARLGSPPDASTTLGPGDSFDFGPAVFDSNGRSSAATMSFNLGERSDVGHGVRIVHTSTLPYRMTDQHHWDEHHLASLRQDREQAETVRDLFSTINTVNVSGNDAMPAVPYELPDSRAERELRARESREPDDDMRMSAAEIYRMYETNNFQEEQGPYECGDPYCPDNARVEGTNQRMFGDDGSSSSDSSDAGGDRMMSDSFDDDADMMFEDRSLTRFGDGAGMMYLDRSSASFGDGAHMMFPDIGFGRPDEDAGIFQGRGLADLPWMSPDFPGYAQDIFQQWRQRAASMTYDDAVSYTVWLDDIVEEHINSEDATVAGLMGELTEMINEESQGAFDGDWALGHPVR